MGEKRGVAVVMALAGKPHIRRNRTRGLLGVELGWQCSGLGILSFGPTPAQAFRNWKFANERIEGFERLAHFKLPALKEPRKFLALAEIDGKSEGTT